MKKVLLLLLISTLSGNLFSQEQNPASVEKSIFGIQTGFLGIWVHNESRLSNKIALRSEIGTDVGVTLNTNETKFGLIPSLRIEPRWYYNLDKRVTKGKNIAKNSGNFVSLTTSYNPDWFVIPKLENVKVISTISVIPKWAIKRTYGQNFTFETGFGLGYIFYLDDYFQENGDIAPDLHLRLGYTF